MPSPESTRGARGYIIPIGGAEDKVSDRAILTRFTDLSGGRSARIAVFPTASELSTTGDLYRQVFTSIGAAAVDVFEITDRKSANDPENLARLDLSTGIFFTGGNQLRLSTILGGTAIATAIRRRNAAGIPVAGTSAGAAFVSEHMIAFGREGATPRAGFVTLSPGLGLTNRVIVDQHFRERDRLGRLLTALAYNPFATGLGLDEGTAAFIDPDNRIEVLGAGGITVVDVSQLDHSSMARNQEGEVVELVGVRLHVLANGAVYDLETRTGSLGEHRARAR